MRTHPVWRMETIRGPKVTELFGDPDAPRYPIVLDYEENGRVRCDCEECADRLERQLALYDER